MKRFWLIMIFSLAVALFIIGVHQVMTVGIINAYWIFMLCLGLLFLYKLLKGKGNNPLS